VHPVLLLEVVDLVDCGVGDLQPGVELFVLVERVGLDVQRP